MARTSDKNYTVTKTKTEVVTIAFNAEGLHNIVAEYAKILAGFSSEQLFERTDLKFSKQGGVVVTLTNPKIEDFAASKISK